MWPVPRNTPPDRHADPAVIGIEGHSCYPYLEFEDGAGSAMRLAKVVLNDGPDDSIGSASCSDKCSKTKRS